MKKIVINGKILCKDEKRGVYRYTYEILKAIDKQVGHDEIEIIIPNINKNLPVFKNLKYVKYGKKNFLKMWQYIFYQWYVLKNNVFPISLSPDGAAFTRKGINVFHDMRVEHGFDKKDDIKSFFKNLIFRLRNYLIIKRSKKLVFVSKYVQKEFIDFYKINKEKTEVVYNSWEHLSNIKINEIKIGQKYSFLKNKSFYFYLGANDKNKNIKWILNIAKKNKDELFILAGPNNKQLFNNITNVKFIGYITDEEVAFFMKNCRAFLFPSFYEGFGIPPLEALYFGSKVICSKSSCLPEIYEDCVVYIDPYDYNVNLNNLLKTKVCNPDKLFKKYSWDKSAKILLERIYKYI
ncbi:glycosyltransferase family 4 protein [Megamonas funiformis]|uniref:glycosyltransferase family 4 protein n=1 Tax=Megamonas funiformis TaxID=437897 RepID=UPI0022DFB949|nr:glycosyltransferase family 1 protein [Megamonas funiformis]